MVPKDEPRSKFDPIKYTRFTLYVCGVVAILSISWGVLKSQVSSNEKEITEKSGICDIRQVANERVKEKVWKVETQITSIDEKLDRIMRKLDVE